MRNQRPLSFLAFLLLVLAVMPGIPARALTPVGAPLTIVDGAPCSFTPAVEVIATPKGAFDVIWVDDWNFDVKGQRFARNLVATGAPVSLLILHGGLNVVQATGTWAGRYELALNVLDFGEDPDDPEAAYRTSLDLDGNPVGEPGRFETRNFLEIAPAAGGDSLQFRIEPPYYGPSTCRSRGLLASRVAPDGDPISAESRVTRKASGWAGYLEVERQPNDTFVAAYATCDKFTGVVARRLNAAGVPLGKPINLPFPNRIASIGGSRNLLLAVDGNDLAVASPITVNPTTGLTTVYTRAVSNGKVSDLHPLPVPAGFAAAAALLDLEASSTGSGYLLVFRASTSERQALFAQALDAQGAPQGTPLLLAENGVSAAIASLPDGRWLAVTRAQTGTPDACTEQLVGTVLSE